MIISLVYQTLSQMKYFIHKGMLRNYIELASHRKLLNRYLVKKVQTTKLHNFSKMFLWKLKNRLH